MTQERTGKNDTTTDGSKVAKGRAMKSLYVRHHNINLWEIAFEGGGEVPDVLKGKWTSKADAERAIEKFYAIKSAKVMKNYRGPRRAKSSSNKASS